MGFKTERQKVHTGKGAIVGQLVFEGEQIPGQAFSEVTQTVAAAEREASDLIHRDRVPRQYHKAVRSYFSKVNRHPASEAEKPASQDDTNDNQDSKPEKNRD